jgi:hypothetical protein
MGVETPLVVRRVVVGFDNGAIEWRDPAPNNNCYVADAMLYRMGGSE